MAMTAQGIEFPQGWLQGVGEFLSSLAARFSTVESKFEQSPTMSDSDLDEIELQVGAKMPPQLRQIFNKGCSALSFSYSLVFEEDEADFFGGISWNAAQLPALLRERDEWANDTWISEDESESARWKSTLPFCRLDNGDMVGLSLGESDHGSVVYLAHDSEHRIIASSLAGFLSEWAKCNYVGPEIWIIEEFLDPSSGYLNGALPAAERIRTTMLSE